MRSSSTFSDELDKAWPNFDWTSQKNRRALKTAVGYSQTPVVKTAQAFVPEGDPYDRAEKQALRDTSKKKVKTYNKGGTIVAIVGPSYPSGAHGHLVEFGHRVVTHDGVDTGETVLGEEFMLPAAMATERQQTERLITKLVRILKGKPDLSGD